MLVLVVMFLLSGKDAMAASYSDYVDRSGWKKIVDYRVYDIDKDGAVEYVGYFWGCHSCLMTSSEYAVYKQYGHMGHMEIYSVYYSNGEFREELIFSEEFGAGRPNPNPRPDLLADEKLLETAPANDYSFLQ